MKKTNYIKKLFTFALCFALLFTFSLPLHATSYREDMGTWSYDRCGHMCVIHEEEKEILNYFIGSGWTNSNHKPYYYCVESTRGSELYYINGLFYYDNDYYESGSTRLIRFPLWIYGFDTTSVDSDDKLGRLLLYGGLEYSSQIDLITGTCNLKNTLSIDKSNFPSWYAPNGLITFYTMKPNGLWLSGGIVSTRWSIQNPYSPYFKSIRYQFFSDNSFQLYVEPIDSGDASDWVMIYSSDGGGYRNTLKNNYIMFDNVYLYSSFTDYILVPNYLNERSEEMTDIFTTIFDTIFEYIYNFLNFSVLGLNIFTALLGVVSILLLVRIIKMFI